jgi:hypothetical protein
MDAGGASSGEYAIRRMNGDAMTKPRQDGQYRIAVREVPETR